MTQTRIFPIASGADDVYVQSNLPSTYAALAYGSHYPELTYAAPGRLTYMGTNGRIYITSQGLIRFDTSALPDDATVISAKLRAYVSGIENADSRSVVADYYNWTGAASDWSAVAPASPILSVPIANLRDKQYNDLPINNLSGINLSGYTSIRLHISGGQPSGKNRAFFQSYETADPEMQLVVEYEAPNQPPVASFSYSASDLTATFTDTSTDPDGTVASRFWNFGDGATSTSQNPVHSYAVGGTYNVALTVTDDRGGTNTVTQAVTVTDPPPPPPPGTNGDAYLWRDFPARHDLAIATRRKVPLFPLDAALTLQEVGDTNRDPILWVDLDARREAAELSIEAAPLNSGAVAVTLEENGAAQTRAASVTAVREEATLTIASPQASRGEVVVTLDDVRHRLTPRGGTRAAWQIEVKGSPRQSSYYSYETLTIRLTSPPEAPTALGASHAINVPYGQSPQETARQIRARAFPGWSVSGSGTTVFFTANNPGPASFSAFSRSSGWFAATQLQAGSEMLTAAGVADFLRNSSFPGWSTGGEPGTATVVWTSLEPGHRAGQNAYDPGQTGAASTQGMATTAQGSRDSAEEVAAKVRALYVDNTYWAVGGEGSVVTFRALTPGAKRDATFSAQGTETKATMTKTVNGGKDLVAYARDASGNVRSRRLVANLDDTPFYVDTAVDGAGTDSAVASVWGAVGGGEWELWWRAEGLDLTGRPAGYEAYGVIRETSPGLTWDVLTDEVEPTDKGKRYFVETDADGRPLRQARGRFRLPVEQARSDLFVQGMRLAVAPGQTVPVGAWIKWAGVPESLPLLPLFVAALYGDGTSDDLGDVTGAGLAGSGEWAHFERAFVVPAGCHELLVASRDVSTADVVVQFPAASLGASVLRTNRYATRGTFVATLDSRTPDPVPNALMGRKRTALVSDRILPDGTSVEMRYRAAEDPAELLGATWRADPGDVLDLPVVDVETTVFSDGRKPAAVPPRSPRLEYRLLVGSLSDQPVFLRADGSEFPGGVTLAKWEDWHPNSLVDVRVLPSGRARRQKRHEPIGFAPVFSLNAHRPETVAYIQERWGTEEFVADVYGESLSLKLLAKPVFKRAVPPRGSKENRSGYWVSSEVSAEVTAVREIAE